MTMHNNPHPILETPRLTLRALRNSDAGLTSLYTSDLRVARMTSRIPHPNPPGAVEAFIAHANAPTTQETTWAIDASKGFGTELVGVISIDDDGDIGYWVAPFFWGLGLASEALDAVVAFAADTGVDRLGAWAFMDNPASQRVLEKGGFCRAGTGTVFSVARKENCDAVRFEWRGVE